MTAFLPGLVLAQAARTPGACAVVDERESLTYEELVRQAGVVAGLLTAAGVEPDAVVAVHAERSARFPVLLLGVLLSGAAYLPLEPGDPAPRLAGMLDDAGVVLVLTEPELKAAAEAVAGSRPVLAVSATELRAGVPAPPAPLRSDLGLAYVLFTSGSTGRPKAVAVPHRGIVNRLRWMQSEYALTSADAVLQKTPATFDVSVWELFWPLAQGARLVMARPGGQRDPEYLMAVLRRERITVVHFVPSMLESVLDEPGWDGCDALRLVVCSGEALPPAAVRRFRARSRARIDNLYGPTEASIDVTWWPCRPVEDGASVPIGRPIANVVVRVLDADGNLVPEGVPGELHLGGDHALARGYLGQPGLTAERFPADPFGDGARLYRTGDLVRWLPGGMLEFLGRLDHQIKLRGQRIEPGEIEETLRRHPAVTGAVVVLRRDEGRADRLVGYVVGPPDGPGERDLRNHLAERLPASMVPARVVRLDAFPLTANGKLDRRALPEPPRRRRPSAHETDVGGGHQ
ncbi:amino acid adenylation domain-containing protein [Micromonospora sp. NPDC051141]|uniref:amino acid adenylation domain-containing protein n=1 Tax=Micromonospora sp. NPDC051141 TaxID=3364284 RepID=UPI003790E0AC